MAVNVLGSEARVLCGVGLMGLQVFEVNKQGQYKGQNGISGVNSF